jgi:UDP-N-acetylglucosamine 2-epimerase (non-hydrolysing)
MNDVFFDELKIKKPDVQFQLEGTTQVTIIAEIMTKFQKVCEELKPDMVVVPGDVNSSFACAFVAQRLGIPVAHIESGLRSFDMTMPEEINRILIDNVSELHFVTEQSGEKNLLKLGFNQNSIKFVGNSMIDSLVVYRNIIDKSTIAEELQLSNNYAVFTFHRPVNVDDKVNLEKLLCLLEKTSEQVEIVFPVHPRTIKQIKSFGLFERFADLKNIKTTDPLGYIPFLKLLTNAKFVITDSGGVQEETTFLKIPCLTIRPNTERPITVDEGTNTLLDFDIDIIIKHIHQILTGNYKKGKTPHLWDGETSQRIVKIINEFFQTA